MDWLELLNQIFQVCVIPLLGVLTAFGVQLIKAKAAEIAARQNNELAEKYINMLANTISNCVIATNQTYVNNLKEKNAFDAEAQKIAFQKTYEAVIAALGDDAKEYLAQIYGDLQAYITSCIEAEVHVNRE